MSNSSKSFWIFLNGFRIVKESLYPKKQDKSLGGNSLTSIINKNTQSASVVPSQQFVYWREQPRSFYSSKRSIKCPSNLDKLLMQNFPSVFSPYCCSESPKVQFNLHAAFPSLRTASVNLRRPFTVLHLCFPAEPLTLSHCTPVQ